METVNITAQITDKSQMDALKAFLKALKIKFEIEKKEEKPYNPEFFQWFLKVGLNMKEENIQG